MDLYLAIPIMLVLLLLKGFFSGSEIALVNADKIRLRHQASNGNRGAQMVLDAFERPDKLLSTTLIGTNLSTIALTTVGTITVISYVGPAMGDWVAFILFTPLFLILGEIVPKSVYQERADELVPIIIRPLSWFGVLFTPFIFVFSNLARFAARLAGGDMSGGKMLSREQLDAVVRLAEENAAAAAFDRGQIRRVISFAGISAGEGMLPIGDVLSVEASQPARQALKLAIDHCLRCLPVYEGSSTNITALFAANRWEYLEPGDLDRPVAELAHPCLFAPTTEPLNSLLPKLLSREDQFAVVVDANGSAVGIITLTDLVDDLMGDPERDHGGDPGIRHVLEELDNGGFVLEAHIPMIEFDEIVGTNLRDAEPHSLARFLLARFQHIPAPGESIVAQGQRFTIETADERAIRTVRVEPVT